MEVKSVLSNGFAMQFTRAPFPTDRYRFIDREFLITTYLTDLANCAPWCPTHCSSAARPVSYAFIPSRAICSPS
jgi:acetoacetate decarboxylase